MRLIRLPPVCPICFGDVSLEDAGDDLAVWFLFDGTICPRCMRTLLDLEVDLGADAPIWEPDL